jgi:hypothetical protein
MPSARAQTVYPTPPQGPCSGDLAQTYPNCEVVSAATKTVTFSSAGDTESKYWVFPSAETFSPGSGSIEEVSAGGGVGPYEGLTVVTPIDEGYILAPASTGTLNSQTQFTPYFRRYCTTVGAGGSCALEVPYYPASTCGIEAVLVGRLRTVGAGETASIGDSFIYVSKIGTKMSSGSSPQGVGSTTALCLFSDASQAANTLSVTYGAGSNGYAGYLYLTPTAGTVTGTQGTIDWTVTAYGDCD